MQTKKRNLKIQRDFTLSMLEKPGTYSFMNFASLTSFFVNPNFDRIRYFCDGFLMAALIKMITGKDIKRVSFDFTSIASDFFSYSESNGKKIAIIGAKETEVQAFVKKMQDKYKGIEKIKFISGYASPKEVDFFVTEIVAENIDYTVVGLGAGKQEEFILRLQCEGFSGTAFSCGGFIRQESLSSDNYYPKFIDDLNLRAFYRMYKEPYTIKRYVFDYPKNLLVLLSKLVTNKLTLTLF
ncbi:WecB/TagA/CpsF family glycosyltransferase [Lacimicrobium alkaliphilum]|uniref:Teichoic acid biosynthesis protein A n=1 Tax=Lacimicrobium alkaliphilum TaxID=1526571 RepID=A0ABQ1RSR3_9ALTE|nr:WecB/TagA/CpsF family glycosyltransferase [Lacimicrobium alkaliphilum]GGD76821.1 teichoic acid biosynthesis protein A [Lacimicrobium alkaliphilum]